MACDDEALERATTARLTFIDNAGSRQILRLFHHRHWTGRVGHFPFLLEEPGSASIPLLLGICGSFISNESADAWRKRHYVGELPFHLARRHLTGPGKMRSGFHHRCPDPTALEVEKQTEADSRDVQCFQFHHLLYFGLFGVPFDGSSQS